MLMVKHVFFGTLFEFTSNSSQLIKEQQRQKKTFGPFSFQYMRKGKLKRGADWKLPECASVSWISSASSFQGIVMDQAKHAPPPSSYQIQGSLAAPLWKFKKKEESLSALSSLIKS